MSNFKFKMNNRDWEIEELSQEQMREKFKEVINKATKWVRDYMNEWDVYDEVYHDLNDLLILLKEVEHD